ncbi:MAG: geranylgeranyl reductase family protein [Candidatus Bipolaricaulota bacterium]
MPARADVVVVGGGPSGALTAAMAAVDAHTVLIERAPNRPARCAGLIGPQGREALAVPQEYVLAEIRKVRVRGPDGTLLELVSSGPKGFVVDRARLDRLLVERAREAGADVRLGVEAKGWQRGKLLTTSGSLEAPVLVGADGLCSGVARWAGLPQAPQVLVGLQVTLAADGPADSVEVLLGGELSSGCFGWSVPAGPGRTRVGLATVQGREAAGILGRVLSKHFPGAQVLERTAGLIPVGTPEVTVGDGVLLVGDAAGQVKPLSGGGLYYGALCARLAGKIAAQGPEHLWEYERCWREELGEEIDFALAARRLLEELSEEEVAGLLRTLRGSNIAAFLAQEGDIDRPASLLREMMRRPSLWGEGLALLGVLGGWTRLHDLVSGLRSPPAGA